MGELAQSMHENPGPHPMSSEPELLKKPSLSLFVRKLTHDFASFDPQHQSGDTFCGMDISTFAGEVGMHIFPGLQQTVGKMSEQIGEAIATPQKEGLSWHAAKLETLHMPFDLSVWENHKIVIKEKVQLNAVEASAYVSEHNENVLTAQAPTVNQAHIKVVDIVPSHAEMLLNQQRIIKAAMSERVSGRPGALGNLETAYDRYTNLWPTRLTISYTVSSKGDARRAVHNTLGAQLIISRMLRQSDELPVLTARWVYAFPDRTAGVVRTPMVVLPIQEASHIQKFEAKLTQIYDQIALNCRVRKSRSFLADGKPHDFFPLE